MQLDNSTIGWATSGTMREYIVFVMSSLIAEDLAKLYIQNVPRFPTETDLET